MAITATYLSNLSFTVPGDLTAEFAPGVRVLADCGADGLRLGTVTGATASNGATAVTLALDAGELTASLAGVWHGNDVPDSLCNHAAQHAANGRDPLASAGTNAPGVVELATTACTLAGTDAVRVPPVSALRQAYLSWQRDDAGRFPGVIPPAYNLFAPNPALPGTTTFFRASSAWRLSAAGLVVPAAINVPRFDYDADGNVLGLRIEGAATRLNTIAAAPVAPENVTVTAQTYTISFYGTGSMVLSGAHATTVVGAGPLPARANYTFTPTAGILTLTPSGNVQHLQLETGSFATSPILGEGSQVARAADVCNVALSGIDFNPSEGTLFVYATSPGSIRVGGNYFAQIDDGTVNNRIILYHNTAGALTCISVAGGVNDGVVNLGSLAVSTKFRMAFSWKLNDFRACINGGPEVADTSGAIPTGQTTLRIGGGIGGATPWDSTILHLAYFPRTLTAAQLRAITL